MENKYLTAKEVIKLFKIHRQTLNNWRRQGKIEYIKINERKFLYVYDSIINLLGVDNIG